MAIPTFVAAGTFAVSATLDVVPGLPAGLAENDILLLICEDSSGPFVAPSGYAAISDSPQLVVSDASPSWTRLYVFWKRATSSEAAPTVVFPVGGNHNFAQLAAWRGCIATGDPWDVTAGDVLETVSTTVTIPGDTTTGADRLVVAICSASTDTVTPQFSAWANADLSSVTERIDSFSTPANGGGFGVADGGKATAGAYAATTATLATTSKQARISIALKPPVVAAQTLTGVLFAAATTFFTGVLSHVIPPTPSAGGNRMGGSGAIRKPPRHVGR